MSVRSTPSARYSDMGDRPAYWQSGSVCVNCKMNFSISIRRHHCRQCGNCVCDSCSQHKMLLSFKAFNGVPQRVCDICWEADGLTPFAVASSASFSADSTRTSLISPAEQISVSSAESQPSKPAKRAIGIRTRLLLDFIDDLNEEIHMDFMVAFHFEDPAIKPWDKPGPAVIRIADYEEKGVLIPRIEILNTRSWEMIGDERVMMSPKTGIVYIWRHYRVVLKEILELERFPFDRQVVKLKFQSFNPLLKFQKWFAPKEDIPPRIRNNELWRDNENVVEYDQSSWKLNWTSNLVEEVENQYVYTSSFGVSREARYYMMNFVLVLFITVEASSFCIAIEPSDFGGRSSLNFTLLLTIVAFKFSMSSFIPKISYQTYLDYYNLICISALTLIIVENFFVSGIFSDKSSSDEAGAQECGNHSVFVGMCDEFIKKFDVNFVIGFNVVWLSFHVFILLGAEFGWFYDSWQNVKRNDAADRTQRVSSNMELN